MMTKESLVLNMLNIKSALLYTTIGTIIMFSLHSIGIRNNVYMIAQINTSTRDETHTVVCMDGENESEREGGIN